MAAPKPSKTTIGIWCFLHLCTFAIPLSTLCLGAKVLDVALPVFSNLVVNFTPRWMLKYVIKPNLNLAKDYADAAAQATKDQGGNESAVAASANAARFKSENEQEIVGHLCITVVSILGLLASALVLNFAYMVIPPSVAIVSPSAPTISTNAVGSGNQGQTSFVVVHSVSRILGSVAVVSTAVFSFVCLFHMAVWTKHFVGKDSYLRQDANDYVTWIWPPSIRCPMTFYRLTMTLLISCLPVVKYWLQ